MVCALRREETTENASQIQHKGLRFHQSSEKATTMKPVPTHRLSHGGLSETHITRKKVQVCRSDTESKAIYYKAASNPSAGSTGPSLILPSRPRLLMVPHRPVKLD